MGNKINIAELLKVCKEGTKLYSPALGNCQLKSIERLIEVYNINRSYTSYFKLDGSYILGDECILFPSSDYRSWEGVHVENGELVIPEVKTQTYGKFYSYGNPKRFEDIKAAFKKYNVRNVDDYSYNHADWLYYIDNLGYVIAPYRGGNIEQELIAQGYKKLELPYQPKDKELVWFYEDIAIAKHIIGFYDAKNHCSFAYDGKRNGSKFSKYEPYEGEYPDWAKEALKHLED